MTELPKPVTAPPDGAELAARLARVRQKMAQAGLGYYVSFDPINIYYLTNFANMVHERPFILVIPQDDNPVMLCPLLESSHVRARARCDLTYVTYDEFPAPTGKNWFDLFAGLVPKDARVGVEEALPIGIYRRTPGVLIVNDIIDDVRLVKTDYEIGRSAHAAGISDLGHAKLLEVTRPGTLLIAIYGEVVRAMMGKTLTDIPEANLIVSRFLGAVWPPSISHDPHRVPGPYLPMEEGGPHVSIVTAQVDGYGMEVERTFFLGSVPEAAKKPFETMVEARALGYELAVPGARLDEIDRKVRKVIIDAGYEKNILHRTGHGLGITGHEGPYLALGDERALVPGMVISIEPGIYIPGLGGFRHSDSVLITGEGNVRLTNTPDTLQELTIRI
jgi:Xaa-Pro dipeptidase